VITSPAFSGRRYAVLGLARSGIATVDSLFESGAQILAWDSSADARDAVAAKAEVADIMAADLSGYDGIVVSPGVPLNTHPISAKAREFGVPIIGDIELFAQARETLPPHRVVAITGTNGKSTTTALVDHIIRSSCLPARMGGNIGLPILSQKPLGAGGVYVLELSSYQIDLTHSLDAEVAALINITPDHLNRYDGFANYAASKNRLMEMQTPHHHAAFGNRDAETRAFYHAALNNHADGYVLSAEFEVDGQEDWPSLQGPHNMQNVAVAVRIAESLGLRESQWRPALKNFKGLPHRMERVAEVNGVLYINDSKATNPASTAPALAAYPRIHWICGGVAKTDNLDECAPNFGHVVAAYTIGEAGPLFRNLLTPHMPVTNCEMLFSAVQAASEAAQPGDVVLLSPACASFDQFKDFESRGDCFRASVDAAAARFAEGGEG
jgi:UDP-N-acetylmuramoylalanine--D-glutamate ligase